MICPCCGFCDFTEEHILWKELTDEWKLLPHEIEYVNRQQGMRCKTCGCNLRSMTLARAIMACAGFRGAFRDFVFSTKAAQLCVLEINEAGGLSQFLRHLPRHVIACYPEVDMTSLPYPEGSFDLVVHSDTLEHVPRPVEGLAECRRVLRSGGFCAFTIPVIVDRFTISWENMPPSYHGSPANPADHLVHTEYGADAWKHLIEAGFTECRTYAIEYPASLALVGVR